MVLKVDLERLDFGVLGADGHKSRHLVLRQINVFASSLGKRDVSCKDISKCMQNGDRLNIPTLYGGLLAAAMICKHNVTIGRTKLHFHIASQ